MGVPLPGDIGSSRECHVHTYRTLMPSSFPDDCCCGRSADGDGDTNALAVVFGGLAGKMTRVKSHSPTYSGLVVFSVSWRGCVGVR